MPPRQEEFLPVNPSRSLDPKWFVLLAVGVGTFMSAVDASVVNTVLPVINRSLASSVAAIEWVVVVYLLVVSGLLLSFGRLGDLRGHKPMYLAGFAVFVLGSALCGLAPTAAVLIAFRALQALGAAMLLSNSPAILTLNFPAAQRGQALGLQASMTYMGMTVGPALGGWLTGRFSWRAAFYINVPVGLLALGLGLCFIPHDRRANDEGRFDLAGASTWMVGLVVLLLALNRGHAWGWTSGALAASLATAAVLLGAFVAIERRVPSPMLDLSLFRRRTFSAAATSSVLNFICTYTMVFLLPFYLIQGRGVSPAKTGLLLTAQSLVRAAVAPFSGTLSDWIGSRIPGMSGMALLATGLFMQSRLDAASPMRDVVVALAIVGLGTGLFISPNNSALMGSAPKERQGVAAAILATARSVGMVLGVGLSGAVLTTLTAGSEAPLPTTALVRAVDAGFLLATGIAVLGVFTSAATEPIRVVEPARPNYRRDG